MFCDECGGKCYTDNKCSLCGHINLPEDRLKPKEYKKKRLFRSAWLSLTCFTVIITNVLWLVVIGVLFVTNDFALGQKGMIFLVSVLVQLVLAIFMLRLKKWALVAYTIVFFMDIPLVMLLMLYLVFKIISAVTIIAIYKNDWEYFK